MDLTYQYQKTITVDEVYKPGATTPPKGFKLTGEFRPPKAGEHFLSSPNGAYDWGLVDFSISSPRLILTEAPVRKQYVFTETGEFRIPEKGEWFSAQNADCQPVWCQVSKGSFTSPRKILTLTVFEIQEP